MPAEDTQSIAGSRYAKNSTESSETAGILELILQANGNRMRTVAGRESVDATDASGAAALLTVPADATYALITVEADATEIDEKRVLRYTTDGTNPDGTDADSSPGHALGDNAALWLEGHTDMEAFRAESINAGKTHVLRVSYFTRMPVA